MSPAGPGQCSTCGTILVAWSYAAHDGDLMFRPPLATRLVMVEGDGDLQTRAALICRECDLIDKFPRKR